MPLRIRTPGLLVRSQTLYPAELMAHINFSEQAGEGNRTLVASLEGWSSTIELHPQVVGAAGFEPATPWSRTKCATKLRYAPMKNIIAKKKSFVTYFFISFFNLLTKIGFAPEIRYNERKI